MFLLSEYSFDGGKDMLARNDRFLVAALHRKEISWAVLQRNWWAVAVGREHSGLHENGVATFSSGEVQASRV